MADEHRIAMLTALGLLVACCHAAFGQAHPFGDFGTEQRKAKECEVNDYVRRAYHYAFWWAKENGLAAPDRVPNAILCRNAGEVAERTKCPATENGGRVLARADIEQGLIYLSRSDPHDIYHESYHVLMRSWNEANAEAFAAWCLKMDRQLEDTKRANR